MAFFNNFKQSPFSTQSKLTQMYTALFPGEPELYTIVRQKHIEPGEYHYFATFVVSLGVRALQSATTYVARIWANGELAYDASTGLRKNGFNFTFFDGNENQGEVYRGMHYRGQMVLRFDDIDLTDFGGAIPAIAAELVDGPAGSSASKRALLAADALPTIGMQLEAAEGLLFKLGAIAAGSSTTVSKRVSLSSGVSTQNVSIPDTNYAVVGDWASAVWYESLGVVFVTSEPSNIDQTARLYKLASDQPELITTGSQGDILYGPISVAKGFAIETGGKLKHYVICAGDASFIMLHVYGIEVDDYTPLWATPFGLPDLDDIPAFVEGKRQDGNTVLYCYYASKVWKVEVTLSNAAGGSIAVNTSEFITAPVGEEFHKVVYDTANDRLICFMRTGTASVDGYITSVNTDASTEWTSGTITLPNDRWVVAHTQEATADTSRGTLAVTVGDSTDTVNYIDLSDGTVSLVNIDGDIDPDAIAIWDSRSNRLYTANLNYVELGVPSDPSEITLETLVRGYGEIVGFDTPDITTEQMDHKSVTGFIVSSNESYRDFLTGVGQIYGFNWLYDADHVTVKYPYDSDGNLVVDYTIDPERLAYIASNSSDSTKLAVDVTADSSLPAKVMLTYFNYDNEYKPNTQIVRRSLAPMTTNKSRTEVSITVGLSATDSEVQSMLYHMLSQFWEGRSLYSYRMPSDGVKLMPTDIVQLTVNENTYQLLVTNVRINADNSVSVGAQSIAGAAYPAKVEPQPTRQVVNVYNPARAILLDIPDYVPAWTKPHAYNMVAIIGGYVEGAFTGATLEINGPDGWRPLVTVAPDAEGYIGTATTVPPVWAYPFEMDTVNEIHLQQNNIPAAKLVSVTEGDLASGANLIALVSGGKAELIQFQNAEETSPGNWRLWNLLRGRYGTEVYMGQALPGAPVAFLTNAQLVPYNEAELGQELIVDYRVRSPRQSVWDLAADRLIPSGNSRKPYAPVEMQVEREGGGDLGITWQRRARYTNTPYDDLYSPPALDESTEAYRIEIYTDGTFTNLVRTIEAFGPGTTYSNSDQMLDGFIGDETMLFARIYQITAERVKLGFTWDNIEPIYEVGTVRLGAVARLGGEMATNAEILVDQIVFNLGGTMTVDLTNTKNVGANMVLGGEMAVHMYEPTTQLLSAAIAGGGEAATGIRIDHSIAAEVNGGGDIATDVTIPSASPWVDADTVVFFRGDYGAGDMVELANLSGTMNKIGTPTVDPDGWVNLSHSGGLHYYYWTPPAAMLDFTTDWTLEYWFKTSTAQSNRGMIGRKPSGANRWVVFGSLSDVSNVSMDLWVTNESASGLLGATDMLADGVEHHIAWVKEGTAMRCYLDGVQVDTYTIASATGTATDPLNIGTDPASVSSRRYIGKMDTVRISSVARYAGATVTPQPRTAPTT